MDHALLLAGACRPCLTPSQSHQRNGFSRAHGSALRAATLDRSPALVEQSTNVNNWEKNGTTFEYGSAANPEQEAIPVDIFPGAMHSAGPSMIIPLDLSKNLHVPYPCTSPNLMGNYVRVVAGERMETVANATSNLFYVMRGSGTTKTEWGEVRWGKGDVFALPASEQPATHHADEDCPDGAATFYWVNDSPLMSYLGCKPSKDQFEPTFWKEEEMTPEVFDILKNGDPETKNRCGVLLSTNATKGSTKTLSHVMWCLYNLLPPKTVQKPHKHSSIAIDLVISCPKGCYSLMGPTLKEDGTVEDPVRVDWAPLTVFTTPPGWWHSHHNDSNEDAWVLPVQDAGLYTYQRTLNIRFGDLEQNIIKDNKEIGATFKGSKINVH